MAQVALLQGATPAAYWGIKTDLLSLITQKISTTQKSDQKEGKDKEGFVAAKAYYNSTTELTIEGLGVAVFTPAVLVAATDLPTAGGTYYIEECSRDYSNEDFVKTTVKAMAWAALS